MNQALQDVIEHRRTTNFFEPNHTISVKQIEHLVYKRISTKPLLKPVPVAQSLAYAQTRHPVSRLLGPRSDGPLLITD